MKMFTKNSETKLKLLESSMNSKMTKLRITNCVFITYELFRWSVQPPLLAVTFGVTFI